MFIYKSPMGMVISMAIAAKALTDALPSSLLDPLEGLSMLNCGKLELEGRALKGVRGAC